MSKKHINPQYKKVQSRAFKLSECLDGLKTDKQILSHLISKSESNLAEDKHLVSEVILKAEPKKSTRRIAVTGAPGVGKSSFLNAYCNYLLEAGHKVAILPVDPSSYKSKGSILGDKTRMEDLVGKENVYVKPMASALELGGVAPATASAIALCERAGYDYIFVETVGVGQSEYAVKNLVDIFLLLLQPGGGDDLQGIKRGIMEMADLILITKADGDLTTVAEESKRQCAVALKLMMPNEYGWKSQLGLYSTEKGELNSTVTNMIDKFYTHMSSREGISKLRSEQELINYDTSSRNLFYKFLLEKDHLRSRVDYFRNEIISGNIFYIDALKQLEEELRKS